MQRMVWNIAEPVQRLAAGVRKHVCKRHKCRMEEYYGYGLTECMKENNCWAHFHLTVNVVPIMGFFLTGVSSVCHPESKEGWRTVSCSLAQGCFHIHGYYPWRT
jgi:hypothetical protein